MAPLVPLLCTSWMCVLHVCKMKDYILLIYIIIQLWCNADWYTRITWIIIRVITRKCLKFNFYVRHLLQNGQILKFGIQYSLWYSLRGWILRPPTIHFWLRLQFDLGIWGLYFTLMANLEAGLCFAGIWYQYNPSILRPSQSYFANLMQANCYWSLWSVWLNKTLCSLSHFNWSPFHKSYYWICNVVSN